MSVGEDAVRGGGVGIAVRLRTLRVERPQTFRIGVGVAIAAVVLLVASGAYAIGSAQRAAAVDGQLLALNSQGQNVTSMQNQTAGAYNTDVKVVRQASEGWTGTLLTSLEPLAGVTTVSTLRTDVAALLADARPIPAGRWKDLSSPGADPAAVDAGRAQLARARTRNIATTAAATTLGRAQSKLLSDLKALAASMTAAQPGVLAANSYAAPSAQQAFIAAEQTAVTEMTVANAQAVVASYDVLIGAPAPQTRTAGPDTQPGSATQSTAPTDGTAQAGAAPSSTPPAAQTQSSEPPTVNGLPVRPPSPRSH